jgi:FkbM family methyltransferase
MQLPLQIRLKLLRQRLYAGLGTGGNVPVALAEGDGGLVVRVDGRDIAVPSPWRWKLYRHGWEARLDRLEREYGVGRHVRLGPDSVVLDIGANVGEFAHVCARYGARVHCFEPDPKVYACLLKNIAGLANASAHDIVIWKEDGEIDFGLAPERADSSVFVKDATSVKKRAQTIASFCRENAVARVDFIKCDAEGAEPEVLEGIGDFFMNVGAIALDTGPERAGARTHEACASILAAAGLRVIEEKVGTRWMTYGLRTSCGAGR